MRLFPGVYGRPLPYPLPPSHDIQAPSAAPELSTRLIPVDEAPAASFQFGTATTPAVSFADIGVPPPTKWMLITCSSGGSCPVIAEYHTRAILLYPVVLGWMP